MQIVKKKHIYTNLIGIILHKKLNRENIKHLKWEVT